MRKKIIFFSILIVLSIVLIGIALFHNNDEIKVSAYTYPYNYLSNINDKDNIDIKILVNNKKTYFTDKDKISHAYIGGREGKLKLNIKEISIEESKIKIKDEDYYLCHFIFEVDINLDSSYELFVEKAYLYLDFVNEKNANIYIGTFSYTKYHENNPNISITSLKAINNKEGNNGFFGCLMGIRNISNNNIIIDDIELLDGNIYNIKYIKINEIKESTKFEDYFDTDEYLEDVELKKDDVLYLAISFDYNKSTMYNIEGLGIRIKSNEIDYYLDKFIFYKINNINVKDTEFNIYEYK